MHNVEHTDWNTYMNAWQTTPPWTRIDLPKEACVSLHAILLALDVEHAIRYKPTPSATHCNSFVSDVSRAAGQEIPHTIDTQTGDPVDPGTRNSRETRANDMVRWLSNPKRGWVQVPRGMAVDKAGEGYLVVVGWDSKSIQPGHIAVLLPEGTIAQAGAKNFVGRTVEQGFGNLPVKYFVSPRPAWPQQAQPMVTASK